MTAAARINANAEMVMEKIAAPRSNRPSGVIVSPIRMTPPLMISARRPPRWIKPRSAPCTTEFFQVGAGIAEARTAKRHCADGELPLDEMIQATPRVTRLRRA